MSVPKNLKLLAFPSRGNFNEKMIIEEVRSRVSTIRWCIITIDFTASPTKPTTKP
jgi:hypothetical protein